MDEEIETELTVNTPWGKLVTVKGLKFLLNGFTNDLDDINSSLRNIETRLSELETTLPGQNSIGRVQALEGSFKSLEEAVAKSIQEFRETQSKFAKHMKQTLELLFTRIGE